MILGIDLGTTNSLAAVYRNGQVELIPNKLGQMLTPSVVSIDQKGIIYTGEAALERKNIDPLNTASVFKRAMGTGKKFILQGKEYKAEELSAFILKSLKEDAENYLGETVDEAVISVPAYFNDRQRKATKMAGELAGFKVERIINEPTAAAVAYGIDSASEETTFLVFDLGGGTLDISILELDDTIMEVRAVAGDNFLGGEDFTEVLYRMFVNRLEIDENKLSAKEITHIRRQAENCKKEFSKADLVTMSAVINDEILKTRFSVKEYETGCTLLFERIKKPIEKALRDSRIKLSDVNEVVLVGGGTKLPIIRRFAGRLMGRPAKVGINPDEAIVTGAALQAAMKERNKDIKEIVLTDVCPYSLGTEVAHTSYGNRLESGYFDPIIERNTVVPTSKSKTYYTVSDGQRHVRVPILQGENRLAKENLLLGTIDVSVPPKPAGEESITVRFTYNINSILEVIVRVDSTGETRKSLIQSDGSIFTEAQAQAIMNDLNHLKIHPRDRDENKILILKAERMYQEALGDLRPVINQALMEFEDVLDKQDDEVISEARTAFANTLTQLEILLEDQMKFDSYMDDEFDDY